MDDAKRTRWNWWVHVALVLALVAVSSWFVGTEGGEDASRSAGFRAGECGIGQDAVFVGDAPRGCTHGDDAYDTPPPSPIASAASAADDPVVCDETGNDRRVQLVYARPALSPDRFDEVRGDIERWARGVDDIFRASSQETGGDLSVRWVTTPGCDFDIVEAVVSTAAATSDFGQTITELEALGLDNRRRHYLVFMDATALCGVGESYNDTRPDPTRNYNNGNAPYPMFGRLDRGCWSASVAAHELMHTLGGVLESAPNGTPYGHCTDEWDLMCYVDGPGISTTVVCNDTGRSDLFDCNHDDYFSTSPSPGGFLESSWNTADSDYLVPVPDAPTTTTTTPTTAPPPTTVTTSTTTVPGPDPTPPAPAPVSTARFVPLTPTRVLDTRDGTGVGRRTPLSAAETVRLPLAGRAGIPAQDVRAVVLNVTVVGAPRGGYVTVFPSGTRRPEASNLNTSAAGQIRANQVIVSVADGAVDLFSSSGAHLVADVTGYFLAADESAAGRLTAFTPERLLDTRSGQGATAGPVGRRSLRLPVAGVGSVPETGVSAVVLNVTATESTGTGYVTVFPGDERVPLASSLNTDRPGQTVANHVIVPVGADGTVGFFGSRDVHLVVDVSGWFTDGTAAVDDDGLFTPISPSRAFDSRKVASLGASGSVWTLPLATLVDLPVEALDGVLVVNATVTQTSGQGYLTAYPGAAARPLASNLNWDRSNETIPNLVTVAVDDGRASLYLRQPAHLVLDVAGFYS